MFKKIQAKLKNKKGFTLVELLIVIAVLGIIAAIAVPRFAGVLGSVRGSADERAAQLLAKEIEAEFMVEGWAIADGATLAVTAANGFNGNIPNTQEAPTRALTPTISRAGTVYTLTITAGDAQGADVLFPATIINGPVR